MDTLLGHHWHHLPAQEVLALLDADERQGLRRFEVKRRQEHFGPNQIVEKAGPGVIARFLAQFNPPVVYVLIAAAVISAAFKEWTDGALIMVVVGLNAIIGFIQEAKALGAINALAKSLSREATVLRDGEKQRLAAKELVLGDIVLMQSGDRVPADVRLLGARDLRIDESALTGESVAAQKNVAPVERAAALGDRHNMAYSSTLVTYGTGSGVVVGTGEHTEIGRISGLLSQTSALETPLLRRIAELSRALCIAIFIFVALFFLIDIVRGEVWLHSFRTAVAMAVAAIPEGLPAAMTIILAISVSRMARRHVIIRKLPAVETLGGVTVICSDKTGTLTQNQMTVQRIYAGGREFRLTGSGYDPRGEIFLGNQTDQPLGSADAALTQCLRAGLLCNDAKIREQAGVFQAQGDPTEAALVVAAAKLKLSREHEELAFVRKDTIPFESEHKYMATLHTHGATQVVFVKGSLEVLIPRCRRALAQSGELIALDGKEVEARAAAAAALGLRVLALAYKEMPNQVSSIGHGDVASELVFLGFQAMLDPPRPEAARAIDACQTAGIKIRMITGDHADTAAAIGRQLGLADVAHAGHTPRLLTGKEIEAASDDELTRRVEDTVVFARVSPEHKLRLVSAFQERGEIVAMTGDGVNDAPALRRANIGIAMALSGTEVAREAADMVLTDDNFASIEAAVEEGRAVYDTLEKFIVWALPTNGGQAFSLLAAVLLNLPLPLQPVQLLWVNMTTAVLLGLTLAFEPPESGLMQRPPRDSKKPILGAWLIWRIILVSLVLAAGALGIYEFEITRGAAAQVGWTAATTLIIVAQIFYLFNCRSLRQSVLAPGLASNPWLWLGIGLMLMLQLAFVYHPWFNLALHSAPLALDTWLLIVGFAVALFTIVAVESALVQRRRAKI